jgi:hypothetical protein
MADKFGSGLQMGMQMARDVRSANLAQADRADRRKYAESAEKRADRAMELRESTERRAVSGESRAVKESDSRLKSLKKGMKRAKSAEGRAVSREERDVSAEGRAVDAAELARKIGEYKLDNLKDPSVSVYRSGRRLLEDYQKDIIAADKRHADMLAPINAQLQSPSTNPADLLHLQAVRERMLADHKDFKAGLELSFMAASNRPYEGKWSIRPYFNEFTNTMSYGAMFEGGSGPEAAAAMQSIRSMGGNVGISAGASAATPARSVDPNDPLEIRSQTTPTPAPTSTGTASGRYGSRSGRIHAPPGQVVPLP